MDAIANLKSGIRDNHTRSVVSAFFTVYAYEAMKEVEPEAKLGSASPDWLRSSSAIAGRYYFFAMFRHSSAHL